MEANLAVLIDFENIAAGTEKEGLGRFDVDAVMERMKEKGRVLVARSYADWGRFARFKQGLLMANVTMFELTSHGMQDKNRADIAMVVDGMELAFTRDYIDTYVVVSGDSDFTPLVQKLRELNKRVIGCGTRSSTSRLLIQACDEFIFYESLVQRRTPRRSNAPRGGANVTKERAYALLNDALHGLLREGGGPPLASVVKGAIQRKTPDFSEADFGFPTLSKFLEAAQRAGQVRLTKDHKSGGYRVDAVDTDGPTTTDVAVDVPTEPEAPWMDPYAPTETEWVFRALADEGYNPLSAPTRLALLECLEQAVADRSKKRRRINIQFVREDVRRLLNKTHPDVPARAIRSVFEALLNVHVFVHRDGGPVRTANANFRLEKTAAEMNQLLTNLYLETLKSGGADVSGVDALAELFLGNAERKREIEEILAWLDRPNDDGDGDAFDDLDALLEFDGDDATSAAPAVSADAPEDALLVADDALLVADDALLVEDDALLVEDDALLVADDAATTEVADPTPAEAEVLVTEASPAEVDAAEEEAPRKPRRRRARKKPEASTPEA